MFEPLEVFSLGFAAVVETALLLILVEGINRPLAANWLRLLVTGAWLWHACSLLHVLLRDADGSTAAFLDDLCMSGMTLGLLLMPSGMLHAAIRLNHTGLLPGPEFDRRYLLLYVPLLWFPVVVPVIFRSDARDFMQAVQTLRTPYLIWLVVADVCSMFLFARVRRRFELSAAGRFLEQLIFCLLATTCLAVVYATLAMSSPWEPLLRILTSLAPLMPAMLFAWYSFRARLIPLVLERTIVYGASLVAVLLLHRVTVTPLTDAMQQRSNFDFILIEGLLLLTVILLWKPLRGRVREALRYLFSSNVRQTRDAARRLSVELSQNANMSPADLGEWFQEAVESAVGIENCTVLLMKDGLTVQRLDESGCEKSVTKNCQRAWLLLNAALQAGNREFIDRGSETDPDVEDALVQASAMWAFPLHFGSINGIVLLGPRKRHDRLGDEQLATLGMLCEQFAATLHNRLMEDVRILAERNAMQSEKLSVLGLIAGSIAHELKNPLSSMRTIASLMIEDLGQQHACTRDVKMIIGEIDRLTQTTSQLLEFARPADMALQCCQPDSIIHRLLQILGHLARQHHIRIDVDLDCPNVRVQASDAAFSEIAFNLLKNAIEAVCGQKDGWVKIQTRASKEAMTITVTDNGGGIAPEVQRTLFDPFVTGKSDGSGLGLYIVAQRVRILDGRIDFRSMKLANDQHGTEFVVSLPTVPAGGVDSLLTRPG